MQKFFLPAFALIFFGFAVQESAAASKGNAATGKKVFMKLNCAICHVNGGNLQNPERPLIGDPFLKRFPLNDDKALAKVIREGITAKGMPASGKDQMSDQDLADVIAYIRSLTPSPKSAAKAKASKPHAKK